MVVVTLIPINTEQFDIHINNLCNNRNSGVKRVSVDESMGMWDGNVFESTCEKVCERRGEGYAANYRVLNEGSGEG